METVFEAIVTVMAFLIYGSPDRPRSPLWRISARVVAFTGCLFVVAVNLGFLAWPDASRWWLLIWAVPLLVVLLAEYELGSTTIAFACWTATALAVLTFFLPVV